MLNEIDDEDYEFTLDENNMRYYNDLKPMTKYIMALHTIQNLIIKKSSHLHLIFAVVLILKHATLLRPLNVPRSALTHADVNYQKANIDVTIHKHLITSAPEHSVEQFAGFIMSTDIAPLSTQSGSNTF